MSSILVTTTTLTVIVNDFTMLTEYSGETNPNVQYDVLFTILDVATDPIEDVSIEINSEIKLTDVNGQVTFTLDRDSYTADITKTGYGDKQDSFTVVDQNLNRSVTLDSIGSFDDSFDNSFDSKKEYTVYDDWFLPSLDELIEIDTNLYSFGVGGFTAVAYWSSSEANANQAYQFTFSSSQGFQTKSASNKVRACRSFTDSIGAYNLRDEGPAGGLIFYISGTTFYEAAPSDQSTSQAWSNITSTSIGTTSTVIGTGQDNTDDIIGQVGHTDSAAKLCDDLIVNN
jgi:hypothetical protein